MCVQGTNYSQSDLILMIAAIYCVNQSILECIVVEKHSGLIKCTIIVYFSPGYGGNIKGISGDSGLFSLTYSIFAPSLLFTISINDSISLNIT